MSLYFETRFKTIVKIINIGYICVISDWHTQMYIHYNQIKDIEFLSFLTKF